MKCIAITGVRGQLCQTISLDHGDCSFITTQIIWTGTISDNIGFSFTTASDNSYLGKAQKQALAGRELRDLIKINLLREMCSINLLASDVFNYFTRIVIMYAFVFF